MFLNVGDIESMGPSVCFLFFFVVFFAVVVIHLDSQSALTNVNSSPSPPPSGGGGFIESRIARPLGVADAPRPEQPGGSALLFFRFFLAGPKGLLTQEGRESNQRRAAGAWKRLLPLSPLAFRGDGTHNRK